MREREPLRRRARAPEVPLCFFWAQTKSERESARVCVCVCARERTKREEERKREKEETERERKARETERDFLSVCVSVYCVHIHLEGPLKSQCIWTHTRETCEESTGIYVCICRQKHLHIEEHIKDTYRDTYG